MINISQGKYYIIINISTAKQPIMLYLTDYQPMIARYVVYESTDSYLIISSLIKQKRSQFVVIVCPKSLLLKRDLLLSNMQSKVDFQDGIHMFYKCISVPISLIMDTSGKKIYKKV